MARLHDHGPKLLFGQTGDFDGEDVIRLATARPECARFIAAKVWSHFARPVRPDDPIVTDLVDAFAPDLGIRSLLRAVFLHAEFQAPATCGGLVKQPVEYVAGVLRALRLPAQGTDLRHALRLLGREPLRPPSVGGWPANGYWLSTASTIARMRFADTVTRHADLSAVADVAPRDRPAAAARVLSVERWGDATTEGLRALSDEPRALVTLALVAPEYVLA